MPKLITTRKKELEREKGDGKKETNPFSWKG
jgi:hypothetical protein